MRLSLLVVVVLAALAGVAESYPAFQLSTGNDRCSMCHLSPVGGGLVNAYGRTESGDTISRWGGDGRFLYGAYEEPDWIKLGVDLRAMALWKTYPDGDPDGAVFPMQGDTYAFLAFGDFSLAATLGPRAQVRQPGSFGDRFGSREYYLMWRPSTTGWYARAGRFLAPFGLRLQDHTTYVRRYQAQSIWEEPFAVSAGKVEGAWEAHVTAFTPVPSGAQGAGSRESGVAALYERRLGDDSTTVVGAEARAGVGPDSARYTLGGFGKRWWQAPGILLQGQLDLALQDFRGGIGPSRGQLTTYLGATWFATPGVLVTGAFERFDQDVSIKNLWRDAWSLGVQLFPIAHWEIVLQGKVELPGAYGRGQTLGFLQLHYYL